MVRHGRVQLSLVHIVCAAGRTPDDTGRPGRKVSNRSSPWWAEGMRQMMSKFTRITSRQASFKILITFNLDLFPGLGAETDCLMAGTANMVRTLWLSVMPWNGNSKLHPFPARQKWQKGPLLLPAIRQSGVQVDTVSLEGRRGAASAMTPPRNSSQRRRPDCEQLEGPWTTTTTATAARTRPDCSFWHHFQIPRRRCMAEMHVPASTRRRGLPEWGCVGKR